MRRLSGGYHFLLTYERRLPDALFLGSKKLPLSEDIVKSEAIVDARWVRNMYSPAHSVPHLYGVWCAPDYLHIHTSRGASTIARSTISGCGRPLGAE